MIAITLTGDRAVVARLDRLRVRLPERVVQEVQAQTIGLAGYVKREKLSGQVLKNRTGTLRRSINARVTQTATAVSGSVGTTLRYAGAHEHGFDGIVTVRAHLRRLKSGRTTTVRAHSMQMHLPERSFLRSALHELAPGIQTAIDQAVAAGLT